MNYLRMGLITANEHTDDFLERFLVSGVAELYDFTHFFLVCIKMSNIGHMLWNDGSLAVRDLTQTLQARRTLRGCYEPLPAQSLFCPSVGHLLLVISVGHICMEACFCNGMKQNKR